MQKTSNNDSIPGYLCVLFIVQTTYDASECLRDIFCLDCFGGNSLKVFLIIEFMSFIDLNIVFPTAFYCIFSSIFQMTRFSFTIYVVKQQGKGNLQQLQGRPWLGRLPYVYIYIYKNQFVYNIMQAYIYIYIMYVSICDVHKPCDLGVSYFPTIIEPCQTT